ncbi:MAG TPA: hypothetical protein VGP35_01700 [Terriglobales bacterium]|nr:hypothetical protein [Terriglobales bacterium]
MPTRDSAPRVVIILIAVLSLTSAAESQIALSSGPLVVDRNSHLVVMEYENWWGPKAVTFQGAAAMPFLQSADMKPVGGGYDSADPRVIQQHLTWFEHLGLDAAMIEVTNNVSCIFNSEWFIKKYLPNCTPSFRVSNRTIRNNTGNTYPAWTNLGTRLKLIPLLGGIDQDVLFKDIDGKTSLEKEIDYFGALMSRYPALNIIYKGKPLMVIYLGAAQDPNRQDNPLWFQIREFLKAHPEIESKYTFTMMAGFLDSQPGLWENPGVPTGPVQINPSYGFWSWVDRLNPTCTVQPFCPYYPSYNLVGSRVENFTASIATAGQNGWRCPSSNTMPPYCPDDALRYAPDGSSYVTFDAFMTYAQQLEPIFLFIHQFNEFGPPDEGFDANTDDDIEPANLWGNDLNVVRDQIKLYRKHVSDIADFPTGR